MMQKITPETWNRVWNVQQDNWDYLSEVIYERLLAESGELTHKLILEAGSGSGRISHRLAEKKMAKPILLDYSIKALRISAKFFDKDRLEHYGIMGTIFHIPVLSEKCDIVWNAGVIEHYYNDEQKTFLLEVARILKPGGKYITLNPYKKSILHSLGKKFIEKVSEYPYGLEMPIDSLQDPIQGTGLKFVKKEYSIGFIALFVGVFKRLQLLPGGGGFRFPEMILNRIFIGLYATFIGKFLVSLDKILSFIFGGYLIVSVLQKEDS